jgi:HAMP domain-containing protein
MRNPLARASLTTWVNVVLGAVYLVAALVVVVLVNRHDKRLAVVHATETATVLLERNLAVARLFKEELVPETTRLAAAAGDHAYVPILTSSIYATRRLDELVHQGGVATYTSKRATIDARTPQNEADAFERDFILRTRREPELKRLSVVRLIDGAPWLQVLARGSVTARSCLECHDTPARAPAELIVRYGAVRGFGRSAGEITSAVSIRMPLASAYAAADAFSLRLSAALVALLLALYVAQAVVHRRLVLGPVARLRTAAAALARGEAPAEPPAPAAAAELQELGEAFAAMARSIASQQEGLEAAVAARTQELVKTLEANEQLVAELRGALQNVKTLTGLLPICAWCGKVRTDAGYWNRIEDYICEHTSARVTHGMCPDCYSRNLALVPHGGRGDPGPGSAGPA